MEYTAFNGYQNKRQQPKQLLVFVVSRVLAGVLLLAGSAFGVKYLANQASFAGFAPVPGSAVEQLATDSFRAVPRPSSVTIPKLSITDIPIVDLGLNPDQTLEVPKGDSEVGWFKHGPVPGEIGPAVLVGHLDSGRGPAVFYRLKELKPGDTVTVKRADGSQAEFVVTSAERHPQDRFPTQKVYGAAGEAELRLITCAGRYSRATGLYRENLVVYAVLKR